MCHNSVPPIGHFMIPLKMWSQDSLKRINFRDITNQSLWSIPAPAEEVGGKDFSGSLPDIWKEEALKPGKRELNLGAPCFGVTSILQVGFHLSAPPVLLQLVTMWIGHGRDHPLFKIRTLRGYVIFIPVTLPVGDWKPGLAIPSTGPLSCCYENDSCGNLNSKNLYLPELRLWGF